MESIEMTNMCMIENLEANEVLVQRRKKGHWTGIAFPGGHVEQGEGIVDSTVREIKEETGLDIDSLRLVGIKHWYFKAENKRYMVFLFVTSCFSGELLIGGEEGDVFWVQRDTLQTLDLASGMDITIDIMMNPSLNEERHYEHAVEDGWASIVQ